MGKSGGRRMKLAGDQDEELADLQRRFTALEDEARTAPIVSTTPRSTMRTQRERSVSAAVRADNDTELSKLDEQITTCLLYTSPSPRDRQKSRMPSSA